MSTRKLQVCDLKGLVLLAAYERSLGNRIVLGVPQTEQFPGLSPSCQAGLWAVRGERNACLTCSPLEAPELQQALTEFRVSLNIRHAGWWVASIHNINDDPTCFGIAHDPMTAALRCAVRVKFGDTIEFDDNVLELLK